MPINNVSGNKLTYTYYTPIHYTRQVNKVLIYNVYNFDTNKKEPHTALFWRLNYISVRRLSREKSFTAYAYIGRIDFHEAYGVCR